MPKQESINELEKLSEASDWGPAVAWIADEKPLGNVTRYFLDIDPEEILPENLVSHINAVIPDAVRVMHLKAQDQIVVDLKN